MPELLALETVCDDGRHNAFTDLIRFRDAYWVCFRTSIAHCIPEGIEKGGTCRVFRSEDLRTWRQAAEISTPGDDRDPKFFTLGGKLGMVWSTRPPSEDKQELNKHKRPLISQVSFSDDGEHWSPPRRVWREGFWLWRVRELEGRLWSLAYETRHPETSETPITKVQLISSEDGYDWQAVTEPLLGDQNPNEADLFQGEAGRMLSLVRYHGDGNTTPQAMLGSSEAPYRQWSWRELPARLDSPVTLNYRGRWIAAGRSNDTDLPAGAIGGDWPDSCTGTRTSVWEIDVGSGGMTHRITLPSAHDNAYAGLAEGPDGELLVSYYSQHECGSRAEQEGLQPSGIDPDFARAAPGEDRPIAANVYLARVRL
jgi:hypothetical protein